jgi:hypothetical protein
MFRKILIATVATAALGAAALAPTAASAHWQGRGFVPVPFFGIGFYGPDYADCVVQRHRMLTPNGWRWRWVRVCS